MFLLFGSAPSFLLVIFLLVSGPVFLVSDPVVQLLVSDRVVWLVILLFVSDRVVG